MDWETIERIVKSGESKINFNVNIYNSVSKFDGISSKHSKEYFIP